MTRRLRLAALTGLAVLAMAPVQWRYSPAWFADPGDCTTACGTLSDELVALKTQLKFWDRAVNPFGGTGSLYLGTSSIPRSLGVKEGWATICNHCSASPVAMFPQGTFAGRHLKLHRLELMQIEQNRFNAPSCAVGSPQTSGVPDLVADVPHAGVACMAVNGEGSCGLRGYSRTLAVYREFERVPECNSMSAPYSNLGAPWSTCCTGPLTGNGACGCEATGTCTVDALPTAAQMPVVPLLPASYVVETGDLAVGMGAGSLSAAETTGWYLECNTHRKRGHPGGGTCDGSGNGCTMNACCVSEFTGTATTSYPFSGTGATTTAIGGVGTISTCGAAGLTYLGAVGISSASLPSHPQIGSSLLVDESPQLYSWTLGRPRLWPRNHACYDYWEGSGALPYNQGASTKHDYHCLSGLTSPSDAGAFVEGIGVGAPPVIPNPIAIGAEEACVGDRQAVSVGDSGSPAAVYDASAGLWYYAGDAYTTTEVQGGAMIGGADLAQLVARMNGDPSTSASPSDVTAPAPRPATFSSVPTAASGSISMTATTAVDPEGAAVEYRFQETTGNATCGARAWASSASYTDTVTGGVQCCYRVQSRDVNDNRAGVSGGVCATSL